MDFRSEGFGKLSAYADFRDAAAALLSGVSDNAVLWLQFKCLTAMCCTCRSESRGRELADSTESNELESQ